MLANITYIPVKLLSKFSNCKYRFITCVGRYVNGLVYEKCNQFRYITDLVEYKVKKFSIFQVWELEIHFEVNKTAIMQKRGGTFERTSFELRDFKRLYGFTKIIEVYFLLFTGFSDKIKS